MSERLARIRDRVPLGLEFCLYVTESVILGNSLSACRRARLQVAGADADGQISNEVVRRLAGPVGNEDAPALTKS